MIICWFSDVIEPFIEKEKIYKIGFYLTNTTNTNTSMLIIVFILFKLLLLCMNTVRRFLTCYGLSIEASVHSMIQMDAWC